MRHVAQVAGHIAQVVLVIVACITVPPIYQNARLSEKNAKLEGDTEKLVERAVKLEDEVLVREKELSLVTANVRAIEDATREIEAEYVAVLARAEDEKGQAEARAATAAIELSRHKALLRYQQQAGSSCMHSFAGAGGIDKATMLSCLRTPIVQGELALNQEDLRRLDAWIVQEAGDISIDFDLIGIQQVELGWGLLAHNADRGCE